MPMSKLVEWANFLYRVISLGMRLSAQHSVLPGKYRHGVEIWAPRLPSNEYLSPVVTTMENVIDELLQELKVSYAKTGEVTDEILSALQFVCGANLLSALDLVDRNCVTRLTCPSGRCLYQVLGSSGVPYTCFTTSSYCGCLAYRFGVLKRADTAMCKHVLAIRLSQAMQRISDQPISDAEMTLAIKNIE